MKLILFGATGMVGTGVLREALADPAIETVLSIGRRPCGTVHPKLRELLISDLFTFADVEPQLAGYDACVWALGISSMGLDEKEYARVTEELTLLWARAFARIDPGMGFCYCSAMGAEGKMMWARVRQRVEAGIQALPFKHKGCVRPGFIRPGPGITSRVKSYAVLLAIFKPLFPLITALAPNRMTTSEKLGRAMIRVAQGKAERFVLEVPDINRLGAC